MKTTKKTILFMVHLPPPVHGAALRNKSLLESELLNHSFNIISLPLQFAQSMTDLERFSLRKLWLMARYGCRLLYILLTKKMDLAYFTMSPAGGAFYRDIAFITLLKWFSKKKLLHFRVKGMRTTAETGWKKKLARYALRNADVVCLSRHHLLDLEEVIDRQPYIVPNGIKVETGFAEHEEKVVSSGDPVNILFLSNLSIKKGVPELIQALSYLKQRGYRFSASLVGGEWELSFEDVRQLMAKFNLQDEVALEGSRYGKEKFNFIERSDIFVFPTYFELFPGVILEAMQFGKAIVTTFEGSIPEMIDNQVSGLLVPQRDVEQLANAIVFLIDHPEKRLEMGQRAKERFFADFTLESFERKMHEVFNDILNNRTNG